MPPTAMAEHPHGSAPDALPRLLAAALFTAVGVAVAVWIFKESIDLIRSVVLGGRDREWSDVGPSLLLLVPAAGGLVAGLVMQWFRVPQDPGHGVTEVIEAATLESEAFPYGPARVKIPTAALTLGTGTSLGPEDPAIEIGGEIAVWVSNRFDLSRAGAHRILIVGAATGVSSAFHAPLAALLMSIEVFRLRPFSRAALLVAVAAVTGFGVMLLLRPAPPLHLPGDAPALGAPLLLSLALGAAAGALAAAHIRFVYAVAHGFHHWDAPPRWLKPAIGGAVLGVIGLALPEVLGIGYSMIEAMTGGEVTLLPLLALLLAAKMLAMAVSHGSGLLGGFFAPSFFAGAALGALAGHGAAHFAPGLVTAGEPYAVIGMAAMLAGLVHAPFTAAFVVHALAGGVELLLHLLVACLASTAVARLFDRRSIYTYTLEPEHPAHER